VKASAGILAALALLATVSGCALDPFADETVAPVEHARIRITEGTGTSSRYADSVRVVPGNVVQFETLIADGKAVIVTIPRGPAPELAAGTRLEGSDEVLTRVGLRSQSGLPVSLGNPFEFDPGYIGIERHSTDKQVALRLAVPRLTATAQGQVRFTFKVEVR
jgi:hypothetical protein